MSGGSKGSKGSKGFVDKRNYHGHPDTHRSYMRGGAGSPVGPVPEVKFHSPEGGRPIAPIPPTRAHEGMRNPFATED
jgi:hypothetical protein